MTHRRVLIAAGLLIAGIGAGLTVGMAAPRGGALDTRSDRLSWKGESYAARIGADGALSITPRVGGRSETPLVLQTARMTRGTRAVPMGLSAIRASSGAGVDLEREGTVEHVEGRTQGSTAFRRSPRRAPVRYSSARARGKTRARP